MKRVAIVIVAVVFLVWLAIQLSELVPYVVHPPIPTPTPELFICCLA